MRGELFLDLIGLSECPDYPTLGDVGTPALVNADAAWADAAWDGFVISSPYLPLG